MSEVAVAEVESDDDFNAGFDVGEVATGPAADPEPASEPEPEPEPPPPKLAQITEDEYQDLVAKAARVDELQSKIDKSFGSFGQKIKAITEQLQTGGARVEVTDDIVAELTEEFPEMGGLVRKAFEKFAEKIPTAAAAPAIDLSQVEQRAIARAKLEIAREALDETHAGWADVVGLPDEKGVIPDTDFRKWLATQPEDYQQRVSRSFQPATIAKALDAFNESKKKADAQAAARRARVSAGVTPRGDGAPLASSKTEDDEFNAGFRGE